VLYIAPPNTERRGKTAESIASPAGAFLVYNNNNNKLYYQIEKGKKVKLYNIIYNII